MVARSDSWSAEWTGEILMSHEEVVKTNSLGPNLIEFTSKKIEVPVKVATLSVDEVNSREMNEVYTDEEIEFIMNIQKKALFTRDALELSETTPVGLGNLGDLYVAINEREFRRYVSKEARFILRGLKQHSKVYEIGRLNNRLYQVARASLPDIRVLALNEYELTAEAVRDGLDKFGRPDIILTSNPNCRPSKQSLQAAEYSGVKVMSWGKLLGALNH